MTRQATLAAIAAAGGSWEDYGSRTELVGTAALPAGTVWAATGCHSIAVQYYSDRPAGWRQLAQDVGMGTYPCDLPDCDVCQELAQVEGTCNDSSTPTTTPRR